MAKARKNPIGTSALVVAGALTSLYLLTRPGSSPVKAVNKPKTDEKSEAEIEETLASVPATEVPSTPVVLPAAPEVQLVVPANLSQSAMADLKRRANLYVAALISLAQRMGTADPKANMRQVTVITPRVGQTFWANGTVPFKVKMRDRLVRLTTLTQGDVYFLMVSEQPAQWPYADWQHSVFPVLLGSKLVKRASTVDPSVAIPLTASSRGEGVQEFTAIPNGESLSPEMFLLGILAAGAGMVWVFTGSSKSADD